MPDKTWKAFERWVAKQFGGTRRGADFRGARGGKNDIIADGYSIECKIWARPTWSALVEDVKHAEERRDNPGDIPLAIMKKKGDRNLDSIVAMRFETFLEFFGGHNDNGIC
jgi:hypothetical protein